MAKILCMISNEIMYKEMITADIKNKTNEVTFINAPDKNLVTCTDFFIEEFSKGNYSKGLVIWITGVAVTNLLNKTLQNINSFTTPSFHYYKRAQEKIDIDILVLGEMVLGYKNLQYITLDFLEDN